MKYERSIPTDPLKRAEQRRIFILRIIDEIEIAITNISDIAMKRLRFKTLMFLVGVVAIGWVLITQEMRLRSLEADLRSRQVSESQALKNQETRLRSLEADLRSRQVSESQVLKNPEQELKEFLEMYSHYLPRRVEPK